jgi:hypothetical protein
MKTNSDIHDLRHLNWDSDGNHEGLKITEDILQVKIRTKYNLIMDRHIMCNLKLIYQNKIITAFTVLNRSPPPILEDP